MLHSDMNPLILSSTASTCICAPENMSQSSALPGSENRHSSASSFAFTIRKKVQLTMSGCLGPCPVANVVLLFFDGHPLWFQSVNGEPQIVVVVVFS